MDPEVAVSQFGVAAGMRIADFGCGSGYFTIFMAKLAGAEGLVTAVDVLDSALDGVRAKAKAEGLANVVTIRSNLEVAGSSGLTDASQDLVLLKNILFQTEKKSELIGEAKRVLKIAGRLVLIDWQKGAMGLGPPDALRVDADTLRQLVEGAGFSWLEGISLDDFHYGMVFRKT